MKIGKQVFHSLQRALRQRSPQVPANKTWLRIHHEFAVGTRIGNYLRLTPDDRERLRNAVLQATNLDPLHDDLVGDRLEMPLRSSNEKLASHQVFADEIHLFRLQRPIPLRGGDAVTPPGNHIVTRPDQLDTTGLNALVVIENGAAFLNWSNLHADTAIRHILALYRGHDDSARQVIKLLQKLRGNTRIYAAVDFDPAGFRIALSLGADVLLVPENYPHILQETHLNKPGVFEKQNTKAGEAEVPIGWRAAWDWIHRHKIAVTQEALLARNWEMTALESFDKYRVW